MVSDLPWAFSAAWDHLSCLNVGREWKILFCRRLTANSILSVIMKPQITWAGLNSFGKLNTDGCSWPSDLLCLVWLRLCYFSSWLLNKEMRLQLVKHPSIFFPVRKPHSLGVSCIYPYVICYSQVSAKMDSLVRACVAAFLSLTANSKWYTGLWWMWPQARPRRRTVCQVKSPWGCLASVRKRKAQPSAVLSNAAPFAVSCCHPHSSWTCVASTCPIWM